MTYIIDGPEMQRVDYTELMLVFKLVTNDAELHVERLCKLRDHEIEKLNKVLAAENKVAEFSTLCDELHKEWSEHGFLFGCGMWDAVKYECISTLKDWEPLVFAGFVEVIWRTEETYEMHQVPRRRMRRY